MLFIVNFYFFFLFQNFFIITFFFYYFLFGHMIREYLTIYKITYTKPILIQVGLDSRHTSIYCTQTLLQIWPLIALKLSP